MERIDWDHSRLDLHSASKAIEDDAGGAVLCEGTATRDLFSRLLARSVGDCGQIQRLAFSSSFLQDDGRSIRSLLFNSFLSSLTLSCASTLHHANPIVLHTCAQRASHVI